MKKIILINGPFASGKSSVIKELVTKKPVFIISFDTLKKFFSQYDRNIHRDHVVNMMIALEKEAALAEQTILCEGILLEEVRARIREEAINLGYEVKEYNIEAVLETTLKRFRERKEQLASSIAFVAHPEENNSEERFIERFNYYQETKNKVAMTFSSDSMSPDEIAGQIIKDSGI
jgi:predicted ABC-type ATPase